MSKDHIIVAATLEECQELRAVWLVQASLWGSSSIFRTLNLSASKLSPLPRVVPACTWMIVSSILQQALEERGYEWRSFLLRHILSDNCFFVVQLPRASTFSLGLIISFVLLSEAQGSSVFPMLAWDFTWPRTQRMISWRHPKGLEKKVEVATLRSPSRGHWADFGWNQIETHHFP